MERVPLVDNPGGQKSLRPIGILILVVGFVVNPWTISLLKPHRAIGPGLAGFVFTFELGLIAIGSVFVFAIQKRTAFRVVLVVISLIAWGTALVAAGEIYLATRPVTQSPYDAFHVEYLNPFYFFSLPSGPELAQANNAVVSVTAEGFRGPGPESKGTRKLAFILGGSAAFGDGASSDLTTISGCLNNLQEEYFFVNAGVPSWNSTQEFYRVSMQLLKYEPDLILVYDGANDAYINLNYLQDAQSYPPGTPESYDELSVRVRDIRARPEPPLFTFNPSVLYVATFPRVRTEIGERLGWMLPEQGIDEPTHPLPAQAADKGAQAYLWNIENMRRLTEARGTKLVVFWQAISHLHKTEKVDPDLSGSEREIQFLTHFHQYVIDHLDPKLRFYDLGEVFDKYAGTSKLSDVFIDPVHLTDHGNRLVASEMWSHISQPGKR